MHHTNFFISDQTVLPACNHEVIYDSPPKNYKLNSIVKINKKLFRYEEYFLKVNKKVLRAEKYSHGLKFYDVCGSQSYFVGFTKWDKNNLCYDLFLGTRKELTIHVQKKENVSLRVCFLHCLHQNNTFCNKWSFMYKYNELTENVYKDLKNFSLTRLNSPEKITLSFAKRNENEYIMVHSFPWTGLTAFAVCASLLLY